MDSTPESHRQFVELLRAQLALESRRERNAKRKDNYKLPNGLYETIEDLGRIEAAMASMRGLWHVNNEDCRKAMMHLSKVAWDLRKQMHEYL